MATIKKPFHEICSIEATNEDFIRNGYRVISFGNAKDEIMKILKNRATAIRFHEWNNIINPDDEEMISLKKDLEQIVFKEARSGGGRSSIGWENGDSYLRYHSGVIYRWFPN